jgi:hypothetical protein
MIYVGDKYKDKAGNVFLVKDVKKRDNFLYHSQMGGVEVLMKCTRGKHKGKETWFDHNFVESCLGENGILEKLK